MIISTDILLSVRMTPQNLLYIEKVTIIVFPYVLNCLHQDPGNIVNFRQFYSEYINFVQLSNFLEKNQS